MPYEKNFLTIVPKNHVKKYNLENVILSLDDSISVVQIEGDTQGATCTALLAIDHLDMECPLIIASFEQVLDLDLTPYIEQFMSQKVDCGVLTFDSIHPRFSYVMTDERDNILQSAEKRPISRNAIAGMYFFRRAEDFISAAKSTILNNTSESGYYLSETINEYILQGKRVKATAIPKGRYFHFHDSHNLDQYETSLIPHNFNVTLFNETKRYVKAFSEKNIEAIRGFFSEDFCLTDPSGLIKGRGPVLSYIEDIFKSCEWLSFEDKNIFVDGKCSIVEFLLKIDDKKFVGTDVITWDNQNKMVSMTAYLYEVKV
jgi:dTDP-glucose pyrophosphorylase